VPYHSALDYGSKVYATRNLPYSARKTGTSKSPFSSQFSDYMGLTHGHNYHANLSKS
jgi:hypothetical protein